MRYDKPSNFRDCQGLAVKPGFHFLRHSTSDVIIKRIYRFFVLEICLQSPPLTRSGRRLNLCRFLFWTKDVNELPKYGDLWTFRDLEFSRVVFSGPIIGPFATRYFSHLFDPSRFATSVNFAVCRQLTVNYTL